MLAYILIKELKLIEKGLVFKLDFRELRINATKIITTSDTYVNNIKISSWFSVIYFLF